MKSLIYGFVLYLNNLFYGVKFYENFKKENKQCEIRKIVSR